MPRLAGKRAGNLAFTGDWRVEYRRMRGWQANVLWTLVGLWVTFFLSIVAASYVDPLRELVTTDLIQWYFGGLFIASMSFVVWLLVVRQEDLR